MSTRVWFPSMSLFCVVNPKAALGRNKIGKGELLFRHLRRELVANGAAVVELDPTRPDSVSNGCGQRISLEGYVKDHPHRMNAFWMPTVADQSERIASETRALRALGPFTVAMAFGGDQTAVELQQARFQAAEPDPAREALDIDTTTDDEFLRRSGDTAYQLWIPGGAANDWARATGGPGRGQSFRRFLEDAVTVTIAFSRTAFRRGPDRFTQTTSHGADLGCIASAIWRGDQTKYTGPFAGGPGNYFDKIPDMVREGDFEPFRARIRVNGGPAREIVTSNVMLAHLRNIAGAIYVPKVMSAGATMAVFPPEAGEVLPLLLEGAARGLVAAKMPFAWLAGQGSFLGDRLHTAPEDRQQPIAPATVVEIELLNLQGQRIERHGQYNGTSAGLVDGLTFRTYPGGDPHTLAARNSDAARRQMVERAKQEGVACLTDLVLAMV